MFLTARKAIKTIAQRQITWSVWIFARKYLIMPALHRPATKVNTGSLKPLEDTPATLKIKVPAVSLNASKTASGWKDYASNAYNARNRSSSFVALFLFIFEC